MGLSRNVSEIKSDILQNFTPMYKTPSRSGFTFDFYGDAWVQKLDRCPYQTVKKCDEFVETVPALDGRICSISIALCVKDFKKFLDDNRNVTYVTS